MSGKEKESINSDTSIEIQTERYSLDSSLSNSSKHVFTRRLHFIELLTRGQTITFIITYWVVFILFLVLSILTIIFGSEKQVISFNECDHSSQADSETCFFSTAFKNTTIWSYSFYFNKEKSIFSVDMELKNSFKKIESFDLPYFVTVLSTSEGSHATYITKNSSGTVNFDSSDVYSGTIELLSPARRRMLKHLYSVRSSG